MLTVVTLQSATQTYTTRMRRKRGETDAALLVRALGKLFGAGCYWAPALEQYGTGHGQVLRLRPTRRGTFTYEATTTLPTVLSITAA